MRDAPLILFLKALAAGERWITIHNHGPDAPGQPVLIQQESDGAARVVAGAGGALNHLRLRGVKSEADYKQEAAGRAKDHREKRKQQQARDKRDGLTKSKAQAKEVLHAQLGDKRAKTVQRVADAYGWDTSFPEHLYQNVSPAALAKAQKKHATMLLRKTNEAVAFQRAQLVADAELRNQAGLGEVPLTSARPEDLSVADLDPVTPPGGRGLGFAPKYGERAEAAGLTPEEKTEEARAVKGAPDPARATAAQDRKQDEARIAKELDTVRDPLPRLDPKQALDARTALDLVKAGKELKEAEKQVREHTKKINAARDTVEPRAYVVETSQVTDADALKGLENDLKTVRTRAFLSEMGRMGADRDSIGSHIAAGAYNSINALALAAGGAALVDRSVVDVLGVDGAAELLARRLQSDLTPEEADEMRSAMEAHHVDHYMRASSTDGALRDAREWHEMANEIEVGAAATGHDLAQAQELNARRREYTGNALKVLGTALGEMESNAALVMALGQRKKRDRITVSMGKTAPEQAVTQARAIGLQRGEYRIERAGASTMLTVEAAGLDRLAKPVSREDLKRTRDTLDILQGKRDEEGWLPQGVAKRLDLGRDDIQPGVAPTLAQPFVPNSENPRQAVADYIGARAADGDSVRDILAGITNAETVSAIRGDEARAAHFAAVNEFAPIKDAEGKHVSDTTYQATFSNLADEYVQREFGEKAAPIDRQKFRHDDKAVDALHRALAATPEGVAAWKPVGDLTPQEQGMLRAAFARDFVRGAGPETQKKAARLAELDAKAPDRYLPGTPEGYGAWEDQGEDIKRRLDAAKEAAVAANPQQEPEQDEAVKAVLAERKAHDAKDPTAGAIFGGGGRNPEWDSWRTERNGLAAELNADLTWQKYTQVMGGTANAYRTVQDLVRSSVVRDFAENMNRLAPDAPLKIGRVPVQRSDDHLAAVNPEERARRRKELQQTAAAVHNRNNGQFTRDEDVKGKMLRAREGAATVKRSQLGMFGVQAPKEAEAPEPHSLPDLRPGERYTVGHAAEGDIAKLMGRVGPNFRPGTAPVPIWKPAMDGKFVGRQRAVKLIDANKRIALGLGVGSGKTSISLAAFAHLKSQGKANRGLFLVPSVAQGQFHAEALTVLEPGSFRWNAQPGASREERIASYKNPDSDFQVVTHQAFRDDMLHLAAQREGTTPEAVADKLDGMDSANRAQFLQDLCKAEGIDHDYIAVDEGHNLLNRQGKDNSRMANVIDAVAHKTPYYVSMTADPVKNDVSEAFDLLHKMDPDRYSDRDAFTRKYGVDTPSAKAELQREMMRHLYSDHIKPEIEVRNKEVTVPLGKDEQAQLKTLDAAAAKARIARMKGGADVEALRTLSPGSFATVPQELHEDVAKQLNHSIGILHSTAEQHAINGSGKIDKLAEMAKERQGKPGVVFVHSLQRVHEIAERLRKEGHSVVTMTGADGSKEKDAKKRQFKDGHADIMVSSDAGAVGANLQRGQWLAQFDTPQTAMLHAQRRGRINRIGQKNNIELIDLVADHPAEARARSRLKDKYGLRDIMASPMDGLDDRGIAGYLQRVHAGQAEEHAQLYEPKGEDEDAPPGP